MKSIPMRMNFGILRSTSTISFVRSKKERTRIFLALALHYLIERGAE